MSVVRSLSSDGCNSLSRRLHGSRHCSGIRAFTDRVLSAIVCKFEDVECQVLPRFFCCGEIVGSYLDPSTGNGFGYLLSGGVYTTIQYPGATSTQLQGINNSGEVTGFFVPGTVPTGFKLVNGAFTTVQPTGSVSSELFA